MSRARRAGASPAAAPHARRRPATVARRHAARTRFAVTAVLALVNLYLLTSVLGALDAEGVQPVLFALVVLLISAEVTWLVLRLLWAPVAAPAAAVTR
jgi:hypothetical protein